LLEKDLRLEDLDLTKYDNGGKKIFIGNLSYRTSVEDLEDIFEKWGRIEKCYLTKNAQFGFVLYKEAKCGIDAIRGASESPIKL
jgi:transformer-2 protein